MIELASVEAGLPVAPERCPAGLLHAPGLLSAQAAVKLSIVSRPSAQRWAQFE
jgi:hypothetical protein